MKYERDCLGCGLAVEFAKERCPKCGTAMSMVQRFRDLVKADADRARGDVPDGVRPAKERP